nr:hypothetical protein [uncultured Duganella sp.]
MQRVFLSYTYAPHPDHADDLSNLEKKVRRVIDAMGLRVIDGQHLGGRLLDEEIQKRIREADALIALYTPQADPRDGTACIPRFVDSEFQHARAIGKATFRVQHTALPVGGLGDRDEHTVFTPNTLVDVLMKILQTLSFWKSEHGYPVQIKIVPDDLAERYGDSAGDRCEYKLLLAGSSEPAAYRTTSIVPEPGAAFVYIPDFMDGAKVRVRLTVAGQEWRSHFVAPHMGGVELRKIGGE